MTQTPLVSILTPAYNSSAFIGDTIASVLAQTHTNVELFVVDDGSTDDTMDVARAAANGDPRVIVTSAPHGGPAAARNAGFNQSRGQFIALLDSDDVWMPKYLEEQLALLERFPECAIVTANAINLGGAHDHRPLWPITSGWRTLSLRDLILEENAVCIMALFRRSVAVCAGGFDPAFTRNEDYEFWLRAANAGFGILQNRRPLGYYRRHETSMSADDVQMIKGIMSVLGAAGRMSGPIEQERAVILGQLRRFRQELVKAEMRASLAKQDAATAAIGLKALSELRGSWGLALAARVTMTWPHLLLRAYDLRRSMRAG